MRIVHEDVMVILTEVPEMDISADALGAYTWVQSRMQQKEYVCIEMLQGRFAWTEEKAMQVKAELVLAGLLYPAEEMTA